MRNFTYVVVAFAAIVAAPAAAQFKPDPIERIVVSDLDLTSAEGRRLLARRISRATELACGSYAGARENFEIDSIDQCRRSAKVEVKQQVAAIDRQQRTRSASR